MSVSLNTTTQSEELALLMSSVVWSVKRENTGLIPAQTTTHSKELSLLPLTVTEYPDEL